MISATTFLRAGAVAATFFVTACASGTAPSTDVRQVVSATSFGMCVGYCTTRLEVSPGQAVLVREARAGRGTPEMPDQRISQALSPEDWREIAQLAAATDLAGLPPVSGCPDCADGGSESLTIVGPNGTQSVTFDAGSDLEPAQPLLDRLRALRTKMTPD